MIDPCMICGHYYSKKQILEYPSQLDFKHGEQQ